MPVRRFIAHSSIRETSGLDRKSKLLVPHPLGGVKPKGIQAQAPFDTLAWKENWNVLSNQAKKV